MQDYDLVAPYPTTRAFSGGRRNRPSRIFFVAKRSVDICFSLLLLPFLAALAALLFFLNPVLNKGPVLFAQIRMGKHCKPFVAYKFRSMTPQSRPARKPFDPVEACRITTLGNLLRRSRIDELPQIINVLKGDMSLIGPRPDYFPHARHYRRHIPGYRTRYRIRPGISGLAQTEVGYAYCSASVTAKVRTDIQYINNLSLAQEVWIFCRTIQIILGLKGQ